MNKTYTLVLTAAVAALSIGLAACSSGKTVDASSSNGTISAAATPSALAPTTTSYTPVPTSKAPSLNEAVTQDGITITVKSAVTAPSIRVNDTNYRTGSSLAIITNKAAPPGGKYVVVKTDVSNTGNKSMDLTCAGPVHVKLIDEQGRQFDAIQSLYKLEGNPECNSELQPGFNSPMTWAFVVPTTATAATFAFGSLENYGVYAKIALQ